VTDCFRPEERSRIMARIRSNGNQTTELRFLRLMRRHRITGWRRRSTLPGRPDFIFRQCKLAVFIDGDFWHGNPRKFRIPKSNCDYWTRKIERNRERDREVNKALKAMGWRVLRIWESALKHERTVIARLRLHVGQLAR
jgi:DNA mismatch endonuclease (patch repair protein)